MSCYLFSAEAKQDLKRIVNRIARDNSTAGRKLAAEIKRKAKAVSEFPEMGHSYADLLPSLRGFFVDDYIVFYFPKQNSIQVTEWLSGFGGNLS